MKNILLILVGGTICAAVDENGNLSVDEKSGVKLKQNYLHSDSVFSSDVKIDLTENLFILSENITTEKWKLMLKTYREAVCKKHYDGVIFAHGTDTLAYSSSLFSIILNNTDIPVFFVSSNEKLDSPRANGNDNFKYAVECICRGIAPNVYVTYRNISDGKMYLHLGSRLRQCENYSEDFSSIGAIDITDNSQKAFCGYFKELDRLFAKKEKPNAFADIDSVELSDCVLYIPPYVGINYEAYKYECFKAVFHGTYHSGTACAEKSREYPEYGRNSVLRMIDLCADKNVDLYIAPSKPHGETYDSVKIIEEHSANGKKINFMFGTTNEMTYVKLMLAYSNFASPQDIKIFLDTEYNSEFAQQ